MAYFRAFCKVGIIREALRKARFYYMETYLFFGLTGVCLGSRRIAVWFRLWIRCQRLQIRDILMKSDKLKTRAKNNTQQDFEFSYFDDIDDALIEGLSQNQDFFSMLLSNDEMKHQVMGIFF